MTTKTTFQLGDLVEFKKAQRMTEEFIDTITLRGIVVGKNYTLSADNEIKVRTSDKDYWIREACLTLLSRQ